MIDGLLWLDASPVRYFTVALVCMATTVVLALLPAFRPLRRTLESPAGRVAFVGACALTLFAFRWPLVAFPSPFNPDEAQFVAQALTFQSDPIPWKSFDGNNAGPLDTAVLAVPAIAGFAPGYAEARIVGLLLCAAAIACIYALVARLYGELAGRLAALLPLAFFATVVSRDFVHYTSETLSLFLLGVAGAGMAWIEREPPVRARIAAATCGLALGALLFAKIQAVPMVAVLTVAAVILAGRRRLREPSIRPSLVVLFAGGLVAVPLFILAVVAANGVFGDFATSYILMPIEYSRSVAPGAASFALHRNIGFTTFEWIGLAGSAVMFLGALLFGGPRRPETGSGGQWIPPLIALATMVAAAYAVAKPQSDYIHYLLWFVMPISALFGCAIGSFLNACARIASTRPWLVPSIAVTIAAIAVLPPAISRLNVGYPIYASFSQDLQPDSDPVNKMLRRHIRLGDRISVWGWMPEYYVVTGSLLGTRDAITQFQIVASKYQSYYRIRYLADFARNRPAFFIDAVSPSAFAYHDPTTEGHETFPKLAAIVAADYHPVGESYGVRLYERSR